MPSRQISDLCEELQGLSVQFLSEVNGALKNDGAEARITCTYRSNEEQDYEYSKGRTTKGVPCQCGKKVNIVGSCQRHPLGLTVTKAKGGQSPHGCKDKNGNPISMAFDFAISLSDGSLDWNATDKFWKRAVIIGQNLGLESGVSWNDSPHMQLKDWKNLYMQTLHKKS